MSVSISIKNAIKKYGENVIIPDLTAHIENGEFFTLLGPSGCGKTTLLRMIAGFVSVEGGTISFDDKVINQIPAHKRNIGMVFQNYAIFPHLTVRQNVEYGLKIRKTEKSELKRKVDEILEIVQITEYQERLPENMSGGQQQRVALARAIVIHPSVLLMDEPLSNLDAKLRIDMRSAIREIQNRVGITTIYVTHDQEEALAISDRIAVMHNGVIQQIDTPERIYTRPYNSFVTNFIGHSNQFKARLERCEGGYRVHMSGGCVFEMDNLIDDIAESECLVFVRPEEFIPDDNGIKFLVKNKIFLGKYTIYELTNDELGSDELVQWSQDIGLAEKTYVVGDHITLRPIINKINLYTTDGEMSLVQGVSRYGKNEF